jgi:CubicO group peptidase (beta-lactamase class C family)
MNHSAASFVRRYNEHYRSSRAHKWKSWKLLNAIKSAFDAAAGIYSSVNDLSKWAIMQMNNGKYGPRTTIIFWKRTWWNVAITNYNPNKTRAPLTPFNGYWMGWFLSDKRIQTSANTQRIRRNRNADHLYSELQLEFIVLTNQQSMI